MSWWSTEDDHGMGPAFKFRFNRHSPKSWIGPDYTQDFDELLEYRRGTETGEGKVEFMAIAVGAQCNRGNYEMDLFSDMKVVDGKGEWRDRCKTVLASRHPGKGNMTFCLGSGGAPKFLDIVLDPAFSGKTNADFFTVSVAFHNVKLGPLPAETFARPTPCLEGPPPAACPYAASEPTEEKTLIHFTHAPGKSCGLNNLMTNDLHGSLAYTAPGASGPWITAASPYYEYMQVYNVTMRRGYAPLEDCNYSPDQQQMVCRGGFRTAANAKSVGRSSTAYMEGPFSGQCSENTMIGSWFSFPSTGECAAGWDVGFQDCSWKTQAFKVVSTSCVTSHCAEIARDALKTGSIIDKSVLDCVTNSIALCPDQKEAMGPTCFSRPAVDIHV